MSLGKNKVLRWSCVAATLALVLAGAFWLLVWRHAPPPGIMKDIQAGMAARHLKDPDARLLKYLDGRYGPMTDPANRQRVFLDFFNPERITALEFLVSHGPADQRQSSIDAMARWVATYRASLTPDERAGLNARFQTPEGRAMLGRATAHYNAQDVRYRGNTAPVISELLRTLNEVEQAQ